MINVSNPEVELRVVLIDDSPFDAKLIEMSLRASMACHVIVVGSREEFLAELERALPDVIISDSNLPGFDGLSALALAKLYCPEVPFVFCSGAVSEEMKTTALALGGKAWLSKDNLDHLVMAVEKLCGERVTGGG
jgi:CheY-like chemotaxis protein